MAGHVTYACNCLNVKIRLANKYYLDGHEKFRRNKFIRLQEPPIEGWKFELSMEGVTVEYNSLVRLRTVADNAEGWITISCHNCSTGDVYSVKQPNTKITYPFHSSMLSKFGDQIIVHKGTIFGPDIDKIQKSTTYSNIFHIILNADLPIDPTAQENEDYTYSTELKNERKHVQKLLKQSLVDLEETTEKKIQAFQREQELLLAREKEKAKYDSTVLWQRMKEIAKTVHEEEQCIRRLSLHKTRNSISGQLLSNCVISGKEQEDQTVHDTSFDTQETNTQKGGSHTHSPSEDSHERQQRRRSSALKTDLLGGFAVPPHGHRRSSYALDENVIANSLEKTHHLEPVVVHKIPHFYHKRPIVQHHNRQNHHGHYNHSLHPLAKPSAMTTTTATSPAVAVVSTNANMSFSWQDDKDSSEEELFPLDEDIEKPTKQNTVQTEMTSNTLKKKTRSSSKYIDFDEEEEHITEATITNPHDEQQDHGLATSVPIAIKQSSPAFPVKNKTESMQSSVQKNKYHPSSSFVQQPTFSASNDNQKASFVGFDYAEIDRRASLTLPPLNDSNSKQGKQNVAISSKHAPFLRHRIASSSDDTQQHLNSNKNKFELELEEEENDNDDDDKENQVGDRPIIPPHILVANTVTDETEALFGSVPRNRTRHRPVE